MSDVGSSLNNIITGFIYMLPLKYGPSKGYTSYIHVYRNDLCQNVLHLSVLYYN